MKAWLSHGLCPRSCICFWCGCYEQESDQARASWEKRCLWSFFFPLLQWITTDKTKKLIFRPGSKVFLVVLSGYYFLICRNCVLINGRGRQVERVLLPFANFLATCLLQTELKQPKLLHDNDIGVITPAVCMWARNGWRAFFCCSYCLLSLRAKCSWGEAESDLKHILLTVFPPADETWLKVKTQLLNTIYG